MRIKIGDKVYDIEISEVGDGRIKIMVDGEEFLFGEEIEEKEKISFVRASSPKRDFFKKEIAAPIAGIVSDVFVREGDFLKKGDKIVTLSAMKMENEIISDFEGRVRKILVKKEQKVKERDILIILE